LHNGAISVDEMWYAELGFAGSSILARYRWHSIEPDSATWEKAFSADDGDTWETSWQ
jgi:hypothetical protein